MIKALAESRTPPESLAADLRGVVAQLKRRLREQADVGDLTPSQTAALVRLDRNGASTVSALAREEGMRSQSMGATMAALQAAGLVVAAPDPRDGRQVLLDLTPACRKRIIQGRTARQDWLTRVIDRELSREEQDELERAVRLLQRLVRA